MNICLIPACLIPAPYPIPVSSLHSSQKDLVKACKIMAASCSQPSNGFHAEPFTVYKAIQVQVPLYIPNFISSHSLPRA